MPSFAQAGPSRESVVAPAAPPLALPPYPPFAALALAAPMVIDATIRSTVTLKGPDAAGVVPGHARLYVTADVGALIRGSAPLPPRISYLLDVPLDARGRVPKMRKLRVLLFARAVEGQPGAVQLVRTDAQKAWSAGADARVRGIVTEILARDVPPAITGIGNAFHVAGTLPGSGETQIFLNTEENRPVSITVTRTPSAPPTWTVALSEIVGAAVPPPPRDTLLWYRLACSLPRVLPDAAVEGIDAADASAAREDYALVTTQLGPCR